MKIYQALDDEILSDEELIEGANGFFEYFTKEEIETISYQGRAVIVLREGNDEIAQTLFHESIHSKFLKFKNTFSRSKIIDSNFLNPERYYGATNAGYEDTGIVGFLFSLDEFIAQSLESIPFGKVNKVTDVLYILKNDYEIPFINRLRLNLVFERAVERSR